MTVTRRCMLLGMGSVLVLPTTEVLADRKRRRRRGRRRRDDYDDHDDDDEYYDYKKATKARRSGEIKPLSEILKTVSETFKGRYTAIEFKQKDGSSFYEIKLLTPEGRYLDITVDAKANRIIKVVGQ